MEVEGGVVVRMMIRGTACVLPSAWRSRWVAGAEPGKGPCSTETNGEAIQASRKADSNTDGVSSLAGLIVKKEAQGTR